MRRVARLALAAPLGQWPNWLRHRSPKPEIPGSSPGCPARNPFSEARNLASLGKCRDAERAVSPLSKPGRAGVNWAIGPDMSSCWSAAIDRLTGGGEDIREGEVALIGAVLGDLDRAIPPATRVQALRPPP